MTQTSATRSEKAADKNAIHPFHVLRAVFGKRLHFG
jgi:hypothetical protein